MYCYQTEKNHRDLQKNGWIFKYNHLVMFYLVKHLPLLVHTRFFNQAGLWLWGEINSSDTTIFIGHKYKRDRCNTKKNRWSYKSELLYHELLWNQTIKMLVFFSNANFPLSCYINMEYPHTAANIVADLAYFCIHIYIRLYFL